MCNTSIITIYLSYSPGRPISLQANSHTICNLQRQKRKNPTLTKQTKKPAKAHYPFRIKSCKKGNSCIRILCAELYSGSFSPSCMLCKFSHLNTRMELLHQTKHCVCETQVPSSNTGDFYKKRAHTLVDFSFPRYFSSMQQTQLICQSQQTEHLHEHPSFINTVPDVLAVLFTAQATINGKSGFRQKFNFFS